MIKLVVGNQGISLQLLQLFLFVVICSNATEQNIFRIFRLTFHWHSNSVVLSYYPKPGLQRINEDYRRKTYDY